MQNDFIDGALGTPEAAAIVPRVAAKIRAFDGKVIFTRDTHGEDYMDTLEGKNLPVPHCIRGTYGWEISPALVSLCKEVPVDKDTFGSVRLAEMLRELNGEEPVESITLIGLCTDICVISNALLIKAMLPQVPVIVDSACCAGVTPESHENALRAMEMCQVKVE